MTEQSRSDEIDLKALFKPVSRVRDSFVAYCSKVYAAKWWIAGVVSVVAITVWLTSPLIPRYYQTKAMLVSHELNATFCKEMLLTLSELQERDKTKTVFATQLGIPLEAASSIRKLDVEVMDEILQTNSPDTSKSVFEVSLLVRDRKYIASIQKGIVAYLENNEFASRRRAAKIRALELENLNYEAKLKSLDSLREIVSNSIVPRSSGTGIILGEPIDPIQVYKAQENFYKSLLYNQQKIAISENIEVVQPFIEPADFNYPNPTMILIISTVIALIISMLSFPFIVARKKLKN